MLDRDRPVPLARQIHTHFERLIREGRLGAGVKLPATRELAQQLGVNRATVSLAYDGLVASGLARAHVGQGTFVAEAVSGNGAAPPESGGRRMRAPIDWNALLSRSARVLGEDDAAWRDLEAAARTGLVTFAG